MIFTPMMYLRAGLLVIVAAVTIWAAVVVNGWRKDSLRVDDAEARYAALEQQTAATIAAIKKQQDAARIASEGYQRELEEIRNRPNSVRRIVRVCVESDDVPAARPAPGRPDGGTQAAGVVPAATGITSSRDIGPDLDALMLEADRCSAQLRGLQSWVRGT